jgi:signal-transduction protein with cAMP-binding, CBS, and nucleotidyltransferase domain
MNDAEFLARVSLFSLMTKSELERIAKLAGRHMFHAGDIIIREGDPDKRLFIIISAEVEVISCKKIREEDGSWTSTEEYISVYKNLELKRTMSYYLSLEIENFEK